MKQLPGTNLFVGRGTSIQTRGLQLWDLSPKPFIALFSFNWQTSQFVMQQFPTAGMAL